MHFFALLAAGAARSALNGSGTLFAFEGSRFALTSQDSALRIYAQSPTSLALHTTTTLAACLSGSHLPAFACLHDPTAASPAAVPVTVGALYEAWHAPPAYAQALVAAQGAQTLSVEDVLRSNGTLTLADIFDKHPGAAAQTDGFLFQEKSAGGYYCLYRHRAGEAGLIPDCTNISGTLAWQAALLGDASVDFVTVDGTNLCTPSDQEELIQQRPMEVVLEELLALRSSGVATPRVAAWQRIVAGCTTYPAVLALYNNASYTAADLFLRAPSGKRVFFVPADPDPALVAAVESNGGRNDIVTQVMWALFAQPDYVSQGEWGFMSPCTDARGGYTTSVVGLGRGALGCGQNFTQHSTLGSAAAVSPSYQLSYGSVPFSAAGKFEGLTLQRQFGTLFDAAGAAFAAGAGSSGGLPDNIYLSSWNEWTSQPQPNPFKSSYSFSMGLGADPKGGALYVDSYGSALSRDLEPSARLGGSAVYDLLTSCTRVVRLMQAMAVHHSSSSGSGSGTAQLARFFGAPGVAAAAALAGAPPPLASCAVAGEACCAYNETVQGYALSRSLQRTDLTDALASADPVEVAALLASGAWVEVCNGYGGGTDFCVDQAVLGSQRSAGQGPFLLHSGGCGGAVAGSGALPAVALPGRARVQRCSAPGGGHFLSPAADCAGQGTPEGIVGCADTQRSSNMPRALHACARAPGGSSSSSSSSSSAATAPPYYHALDVQCLPGDAQTLLGYAH
jgi:hypothetical protein